VLLVIDNYDSFTFNLVQMLGALGADPRVVRNDACDIREIRRMAPRHIVVSPGPCTPDEAGISVEVFRALGPDVPMLGVCLGHQCLGEAHGGRTVRAQRAMHGKTGSLDHDGTGLFEGLPSPLVVARYHSLVTDPEALPETLVPVAWTGEEDGHREVQALRHVEHPSWGVQFHPESLFSEGGERLLENFLRL
jgi:anthranilate synthase/aminodeoxychorismate synthase-like glutamine amidotransferase